MPTDINFVLVIGELLTSHVSSMTVEVLMRSIYAVYSPKSPPTKVRMVHLNPPASENEIQYFLYQFLCAGVYYTPGGKKSGLRNLNDINNLAAC